jgi:hypothetical protein
MSSAWSQRAGAPLFLALCYACGGCHSAGEASTPSGGATGAQSGTSTPLVFEVALGLTCADDAGVAGICVAPSQLVTLAVQGTPGSVVTLSLQGEYADAALTVQQLTLTENPAQLTLESSSVTASFSIVASAGVQRAVLPVTVATSGSATIEASPIYSGHRPATEFYATDFALSTCAELTANAPDASTETWTSGPSGVAIGLSAPAGERVAVQMRIGHYAFGCADVDPLVPQATVTLPVQIYDVPMALALTNLTATFTFTPDDAAATMWEGIAGAAIARIEAGFFASATPDGTALLDAMSTAIGVSADQAQFAAARQEGGWDAVAASWMSAHPPTLNNRAENWLLAAASDPSLGPLVATIGNGSPTGTAPVTVVTLGALSWVSAGIAQPAPFQWTADANDTVHLSGAFDFNSTPFLAHQADQEAALATTGATDVASAITLGIDCAGLAASLVGTSASYGTCDAECTSDLCATALSAAWKSVAAPAADGSDAVHTIITASAPAQVGDLAEPAFVQGGWLGSVSGAGVPDDAGSGSDGAAPTFAITGSLVATEVPANTTPPDK